MALKVAFVLNPLPEMKFREDTSFALMTECARRGHRLWALESRDLALKNGVLWAEAGEARPDPARGVLIRRRSWIRLDRMHALFLRKEPPFDADYLACTYLLDFLRHRVFMVNDPSGVRRTNEKLGILAFPGLHPASACAYRPRLLRKVLQGTLKGGVVLKRLDEKGGEGVVRSRTASRGFDAAARELIRASRGPVMAQKFVPHDRSGDKRILILGGRPIGAFTRYPRGDFRANVSRGAVCGPARLTRRDRAIIRRLAPSLRQNGLYFTGIDVLDGNLTEINVTSPAGIPEINAFDGTRLESRVMDFVERKI